MGKRAKKKEASQRRAIQDERKKATFTTPKKGPISSIRASTAMSKAVQAFLECHRTLAVTTGYTPIKVLVRKESKEDFVDVSLTSETKEAIAESTYAPHERKAMDAMMKQRAQELSAALVLAKSLFKADTPYRTKLHLTSVIQTSAAGLLNSTLSVANVSSVQEWSSIDALFDEFFVHSMTVRGFPRNRLDAAFAFAVGQTAPVIETTGTNTTGSIWNAGLVMACYFGTTGAATSAQTMLNNPNHKIVSSSGKHWSYAWRNNVRFDPRGPMLPSTSGWQDWTQISGPSNYGGLIQWRVIGDSTIGTGASAVTICDIDACYDVSFRVRA
jgi:hypothetical protein